MDRNSKVDNKFIDLVVQMAVDNARSGKGGPFAAMIVQEGEVVSTGTNIVTDSNDPTAHAEIVAIRNACSELRSFQLTGCTLYSSCEPCPMCLGAIYWARPDEVVFAASRTDAANVGFDDEFIYDELKLQPGERSISMRHVRHERAVEAFEIWNGLSTKVRY